MLTIVLAVAVVGIALLAAAVLTDNTIIAVIVIAVAAVGLVLLVRDWLQDRGDAAAERESQSDVDEEDVAEPAHVAHEEGLEPDEFEPDVPYEEGGEANDDN